MEVNETMFSEFSGLFKMFAKIDTFEIRNKTLFFTALVLGLNTL
jgi:hypothetical protein